MLLPVLDPLREAGKLSLLPFCSPQFLQKCPAIVVQAQSTFNQPKLKTWRMQSVVGVLIQVSRPTTRKFVDHLAPKHESKGAPAASKASLSSPFALHPKPSPPGLGCLQRRWCTLSLFLPLSDKRGQFSKLSFL